MDTFWPYFIALAPTVGVAFLFYIVIKNMLEGDRKERIAHAQWEAEQERLSGDASPNVASNASASSRVTTDPAVSNAARAESTADSHPSDR